MEKKKDPTKPTLGERNFISRRKSLQSREGSGRKEGSVLERKKV